MKNKILRLNLEEFLFLLGFIFLFYSRILVSVFNFPSIINFLHYAFFFFVFLIECFTSPKRKSFFFFFISLALLCLISAFVNNVSLINSFLEFLLLGEFYFAISFIESKPSKAFRLCLKEALEFSFLINLIFVFIQYFFLGCRTDFVQGIFLGMGAGAHICGSFNILAIIYYLFEIRRKPQSKVLYILLSTLNLISLLFCDNKQSLFAALFCVLILFICNLIKKHNTVHLKFALLFVIVIICYYFIMKFFYPIGLGWLNESYLLNGIRAKFKVFSYLDLDGIQFLIGKGPGLSIGRLAQMLPDYPFLLSIGAQSSSIYSKIWGIQQGYWITNNKTGSSFFSLFFSFAGIFGDLGFLGLVFFFSTYFYILKRISKTRLSKFTILFYIIHGFIFLWLEEPNFSIACVCVLYFINKEDYIHQIVHDPVFIKRIV